MRTSIWLYLHKVHITLVQSACLTRKLSCSICVPHFELSVSNTDHDTATSNVALQSLLVQEVLPPLDEIARFNSAAAHDEDGGDAGTELSSLMSALAQKGGEAGAQAKFSKGDKVGQGAGMHHTGMHQHKRLLSQYIRKRHFVVRQRHVC